jgi:hypothetical protein
MQVILGYTNPPFLDELDDIISDDAYHKIVAAYPRGHGKSSHLSVGYPAWLIAQNHNIRIVICSNTADVAQKMLRGVLNIIENNPRYQEFARYCDPNHIGVIPKMRQFGSRKVEENWSGRSVTIDRDDINLKDPTLQALGLFGSVVGRRADVVIADDIVDQKNSATEEQRQKIKEWFDTTLRPILIPVTGRLLYLGNTWQMDDLIQTLLADPSFDYHNKLKSIIHEPDHPELWQQWAQIRLNRDVEPRQRMEASEKYYQENKQKMEQGVQVLWPEVMPYKELYLIRQSSGSYAFARMYQCDPASRPDQRFEEKWIELAKQKGKNLILQDAERQGFTMDVTTSGLDLAISLKESADDTVLLTIDRVKYGDGFIMPGDIVIRNIRRGKMTPNEVRIMVKNHNDFVHPEAIRVESVAYQQSMVNDLIDMGMINIRGYKTGGEKNDLEIGINSIAILLENGKLVIPYNPNDPRTIDECAKLINEMRSYPDGHTGDSLMALWFAFLEMRDLGGNRFIFAPPTQQSQLLGPLNEEAMKAFEQQADISLIKQSSQDRRRRTVTPKKSDRGFVF